MGKTTYRQIAVATVILLISTVFCALLYSQARTLLHSISVTDTEADVNAVEQLLKLAQSYPTGAFPQDDLDPSIQNAFMQYSLTGDSKCWSAIQNVVSKDGNSYTITANDPFRQFGRDVDNSLVEVRFQDGNKIAFTFYQQTMVGCSVELSETK
jgi:hypothetical protein